MADERPTAFNGGTPLAFNSRDWGDFAAGVDISDTTDNAAGSDAILTHQMLTRTLTSDATANSTTTPAKITGLDLTCPAGIYTFEYFIRYQAAATTTGVKFDVNHSGTVTAMVWNQRWVDVSATASTAAADQDEILSTGGVMGAFASRAKGTAGRGTTLSVDTANADMLMIIEGLVIVTASGDLQLYHGSEVAASSQVMAGSMLRIVRGN